MGFHQRARACYNLGPAAKTTEAGPSTKTDLKRRGLGDIAERPTHRLAICEEYWELVKQRADGEME